MHVKFHRRPAKQHSKSKLRQENQQKHKQILRKNTQSQPQKAMFSLFFCKLKRCGPPTRVLYRLTAIFREQGGQNNTTKFRANVIF